MSFSQKLLTVIFILVSALFLFNSCKHAAAESPAQLSDGSSSENKVIEYDGTQHLVELSNDVSNVTIKNANGKKVYFMRANYSEGETNTEKGEINEEGLSYVESCSGFEAVTANTARRVNNNSSKAEVKNGRALDVKFANLNNSGNTANKTIEPTGPVTQTTVNVGDTRTFHIPVGTDENGEDVYGEFEFEAYAVGKNVIVWVISEVAEESYKTSTRENVTKSMCNALVNKFDDVYAEETALFGPRSTKLIKEVRDFSEDLSEYTVDKLVDLNWYCDIANYTNLVIYNMVTISNEDEGTVGFFSQDDYFVNGCQGVVSNQGSFLYISDKEVYNASNSKKDENGVSYDCYLTVAHEFMHSLQLVRKTLEENKAYSWNDAYGEILGSAIEYIFGERMGIPVSSGAVHCRMAYAKAFYYQTGIFDYNEVGYGAYANYTMFAIFLIKNYGGVDLIKEMITNNTDGWESLFDAIKTVTGKTVTKEQILTEYVQAFCCKGSDFTNNMNKDTTYVCEDGSKLEMTGVNFFDLTEHGYYTDEELSGGNYKAHGDNGDYSFLKDSIYLIQKSDMYAKVLRPEAGFHVCTVNGGTSVVNSDTAEFTITETEKHSSAEKKYVLISD